MHVVVKEKRKKRGVNNSALKRNLAEQLHPDFVL